mmetsp:Transcript_36102/g.96607  ORF Transcript_36102/g.96607 Transcript_36102/m.96607 type:complete len:280 (-) Transcript_36102:46-885(-)
MRRFANLVLPLQLRSHGRRRLLALPQRLPQLLTERLRLVELGARRCRPLAQLAHPLLEPRLFGLHGTDHGGASRVHLLGRVRVLPQPRDERGLGGALLAKLVDRGVHRVDLFNGLLELLHPLGRGMGPVHHLFVVRRLTPQCAHLVSQLLHHGVLLQQQRARRPRLLLGVAEFGDGLAVLPLDLLDFGGGRGVVLGVFELQRHKHQLLLVLGHQLATRVLHGGRRRGRFDQARLCGSELRVQRLGPLHVLRPVCPLELKLALHAPRARPELLDGRLQRH